MRQSSILVAAAALLLGGCDRSQAPAATRTDGIVSLTPAGTDLLVAMGLADRVVGISAFEPNDSLRRKLPKVGDYLNVDFERLAALKPKYLVVQGKRDRLPPGVREKCRELGVTTIILQIDRLPDIAAAVKQIGEVINESAAANKLVADLERRQADLQAKRRSPPVQSLLLFDEAAKNCAGRQTFIDDALVLAGGENVVTTNGYPTLDAEKLRTLTPAVTFLLLPGADENVVRRATANAMATLKSTRVVPITTPDALMPGEAATRLAETMAASLRAGQ